MSSAIESAALKELVDRMFRERSSWEDLIKAIRRAAETGIFEAQKIALSHPGWRRFCNDRIKDDPGCRKQAIHHIRDHGPDGLIAFDGNQLRVVEPDRRA